MCIRDSSSAMELKDKIIRGQEKLFQFSIYIALRENSIEDINKSTNLLETILASKLFNTRTAYLQQIDAMQSVLPRLEDKLKQKRNLNSTSSALTFPFISSEVFHKDGTLYGINKSNDSLVIIDRFSLNNANSIVFAQSGSGKSYLSKIEILRQLMIGTQVIVIDPEDEYRDLCNHVKGQYIDIDIDSDNHINPFDISNKNKKQNLSEFIQELTEILDLLTEGLDVSEKAVIDKALTYLYSKARSNTDISDLYRYLKKNKFNLLANKLEKYVKGSLKSLFVNKTNIDLDNRLVVFGIKNLPSGIKQLMMLIISNYISNKVKNDPVKRLLVIDEGWMLLENDITAQFIAGLVRRARKYYLGVSIISQQANDFLNNKYGSAIASQSSMRILLKQDTTSIDRVSLDFSLSNYEKSFLLNCGKGDALFILDRTHVAVEVIASNDEHPIITTNPKEKHE